MSVNKIEIATGSRNVGHTVPLTEAVENDAITPDRYARERARMVGQGNILENVIIPVFLTVWRRLFPGDPNRK